jgi:hypothetical protein
MTDIMIVVYEKFEEYCRNEDYDNIKWCLEKFEELANHDYGYYFEIVAEKGNLELIKLFLSKGARIDIDNNYVLYTCSVNKHYDCLKYLLECGCDIENIKHTNGYSDAIAFINENGLLN